MEKVHVNSSRHDEWKRGAEAGDRAPRPHPPHDPLLQLYEGMQRISAYKNDLRTGSDQDMKSSSLTALFVVQS
jgi:hypothetical protein